MYGAVLMQVSSPEATISRTQHQPEAEAEGVRQPEEEWCIALPRMAPLCEHGVYSFLHCTETLVGSPASRTPLGSLSPSAHPKLDTTTGLYIVPVTSPLQQPLDNHPITQPTNHPLQHRQNGWRNHCSRCRCRCFLN